MYVPCFLTLLLGTVLAQPTQHEPANDQGKWYKLSESMMDLKQQVEQVMFITQNIGFLKINFYNFSDSLNTTLYLIP